jgi:signal transduction histidine kinase
VLKSLKFRLAASFLAIVFVTLAAAGVTLYARLDSYRDDLTASTLRQVAAPIYYNVTLFTPPQGQRPALANQRLRRELTQYLELTAREGVLVIPVDAEGKFITNEGESPEPGLDDERFIVPPAPERGPDFSELPLYAYETTEGSKLVYVTVPMTTLVRGQREGIHAIVIAVPETSRRDVFGDLFGRLLLSGGVGMAAAGIVIALLWMSLYRPLAKVGRGVRAVAAGDYGQRILAQGPSEVRDLARDVNTMADSVQASQRTLREFLANVSHELKTPLTSIRGFSQAMLDGTLDTPEERVRAARVIDAESRRVLHLVGELLDLSRIESGQQQMHLADLRIDELLSHMRDVFLLRAADTGIALDVIGTSQDGASSLQSPTSTARIRADFDRIEQVLGNLLDNAFRHTARGGRIEAGARDAGAFIELYVADDGEGVSPEDLPHVFDRFYRSQLGEPEMPSAGLGLAISREIVRAHGGVIRAVARPGGGAEFAFTLPRANTPPPSHARDPRPSPASDGSPAPQA